MGLGSLVFSLPHFITDPYLESLSGDNASLSASAAFELCSDDKVTLKTACLENAALTTLSNYRYYFVLGQIMHGVGAAPLITLGTTLLDESVSKKNSPMYIGIFQTLFVVGPAIGYIVGGKFLDFYTDLDTVSAEDIVSRGLTTASPKWVGAWWIGFVLAWLMAWGCAFIIGLYPATLPNAERHNQVKASDGFGRLRDLPKAMKVLFTNPTYMFINLGGAMDGFSVSGLAAFLPKFLQSQFGLTSGLAAMVVGAIVVPGGGGGTFLGGFITKRFKLTRSGVIKMYMYCQVVTVPLTLAFLLTCPNADFVGVTSPYKSQSLSEGPLQLSAECNADCSCSDYHYDPVCGSDNLMYFNPCFAGCGGAADKLNYTSCGCIEDNVQTAAKEHCDVHCNYLWPFAILMFVSVFFTFMSAMPNVVATLRAVEPVHRSLALGIESIFLRLGGTIPGPVFFGFLLDRTCSLWQAKETCGENETDGSGSCLFYDNWSMGISMLVATIIVKALAILFFSFALFFSKRSHIPDAVEDDD